MKVGVDMKSRQRRRNVPGRIGRKLENVKSGSLSDLHTMRRKL